MHGPSYIKQMNDETAHPDVKLVHSQGDYIAIPQTKKGAQFVESRYAHNPATLGGRRISVDEHMTLVASQAEAFGITLAK